MKICLACRESFTGDDFHCPACGHCPECLHGYPAFAPELAASSDGFKAGFYASLAEVEVGNFWFESRNRILIWALQRYFPSVDTFLEIGCGSGFVLSGIQREFHGLKLSGSDIFSEGLTYAEKRVSDATLFQMDARNMPFEDEFHVIGAFDVLEHIGDDMTVLYQMFRTVKTGGGIIITVPQHRWLWSINDKVACHKRRYSRTDLVEKVIAAGFRVLRVTSFVSLLFPVMAASRLRWSILGMKQKDRIGEILLPYCINTLLKRICDIERDLIMKGVSFPMGGSLLCVGYKK